MRLIGDFRSFMFFHFLSRVAHLRREKRKVAFRFPSHNPRIFELCVNVEHHPEGIRKNEWVGSYYRGIRSPPIGRGRGPKPGWVEDVVEMEYSKRLIRTTIGSQFRLSVGLRFHMLVSLEPSLTARNQPYCIRDSLIICWWKLESSATPYCIHDFTIICNERRNSRAG